MTKWVITGSSLTTNGPSQGLNWRSRGSSPGLNWWHFDDSRVFTWVMIRHFCFLSSQNVFSLSHASHQIFWSCHFAEMLSPKYPKFLRVACLAGLSLMTNVSSQGHNWRLGGSSPGLNWLHFDDSCVCTWVMICHFRCLSCQNVSSLSRASCQNFRSRHFAEILSPKYPNFLQIACVAEKYTFILLTSYV